MIAKCVRSVSFLFDKANFIEGKTYECFLIASGYKMSDDNEKMSHIFTTGEFNKHFNLVNK